MRKVIIIAVGVVIIITGYALMKVMSDSGDKPKPSSTDKITTVFTEKVNLSDVPVFIESTGVLEALERMELFSEVQGVMQPDGGRFKEGVSFSRGQTLVSVRANDVRAQLVAQRSSFQRLLTSIMADLRLDYENDFSKWNNYLTNLDVDKSLPELPSVSSERLKLFLTGRSIYSEYYNIKNAEINLSKFQITAPYSGILVEANADPGTVIRPGQRLGVFIKPNVYELEVAVSADVIEKLAKGQKARLALDKYFDKTWEGTISRINRTVNQESQLCSVFIKANSEELRDGMFMHAEIQAATVEDALEVSRSMLFNENKVFIVRDSILVEKAVKIMHQSQNGAVIKGLGNGDELLNKIPPGAFAGMKVNIYTENSTK